MIKEKSSIRLTQYSHGAGCGCKISPRLLEEMLAGNLALPDDRNLLVGNHSKDDAAVFDLGNGQAVISTTDFFMPIVDDPFEFGRIAGANAISDIYAMGGSPLMALAVLGWPVNKIPAAVARQVIEGGRSICAEAGIPLAGGHSIDSPEPIFGLAVTGLVDKKHIKQNNTARAGDVLFLSKPLGVGILTTAEKKGLLKPEHAGIAARQMAMLNRVGEQIGKLEAVSAMTDVTGFGLFGHLAEMAEGSNLTALIPGPEAAPLIDPDLAAYIRKQCVPGGTHRNWDSFGDKISLPEAGGEEHETVKCILADPQTSGGLLIAVSEEGSGQVKDLISQFHPGMKTEPIGYFVPREKYLIRMERIR